MRRILSYSITALLLPILLLSTSAYAAIDMSKSRGDVASYVGSFSQSIPIAVAPGRAGMQPALGLQYSSSLGNGLYGYGWNLDITRIERNSKMGAPKYNSTDTYLLVMKGARQALVNVGGNEYRVANESAFLKITRTQHGWEIRDQKNTVYTLGAAWPTSGLRTFSWSLSHVADVKGNSMDYSYSDGDQGHRLTQITYAANNSVAFEYEARPDTTVSYRSGHRSHISVRLKAVRSYTGFDLASHIGFSYGTKGEHDSRSLLTKATVFDVDDLLPARSISFDYTQQKQGVANGEWTDRKATPRKIGNRTWRKITGRSFDANGDGVLETATGTLFRGGRTTFTTSFTLPDQGIASYAYRSGGNLRFATSLNDIPNRYRRNAQPRNYYERAIIDINGDGFMDWVFRDTSGWKVYFHNGTGLNATAERWADPSGSLNRHGFYDVNGDGLPDLLYSANYSG